MELKRAIPYDINISPSANNGFIIKVGCGQFVAESKEALISSLQQFLNNPDKFEKEYNAKVLRPEEAEKEDECEEVPPPQSHAFSLTHCR